MCLEDSSRLHAACRTCSCTRWLPKCVRWVPGLSWFDPDVPLSRWLQSLAPPSSTRWVSERMNREMEVTLGRFRCWRGCARRRPCGACVVWWSPSRVPSREHRSKVWIVLFNSVQHDSSGGVLKSSLEIEGDLDSGRVGFGEVLDGLDHLVGSVQACHPVLSGPADAFKQRCPP